MPSNRQSNAACCQNIDYHIPATGPNQLTLPAEFCGNHIKEFLLTIVMVTGIIHCIVLFTTVFMTHVLVL